VLSLSEVEAMTTRCRSEVNEVVAEAEALGTLNSGPPASPVDMFRHVYAEMPPHLQEQRQELGF
jgi:2-oxoisovalerate dehydrogenase E1 component alpha subunit